MTSMNFDDLVAFDVHTHAEVSCRQPTDEYGREFDEAASKYFKFGKRPTIAETVTYYRERKIAFVMFAVDAEFETGRRRIPRYRPFVRRTADARASYQRALDLTRQAPERRFLERRLAELPD